MGFASLLCNHAYKQLFHCWLSKWNKSSIAVISQNFTGKNIHWQPGRENVASASDVIIKGDKSSKGNLWKIKGCRGGVGVVLEDVLVAWSVGPVPTKHLISLIKRTLAWYVVNSGDSGHAPSLHSPPLSHTHPDTAISHNNTRDKREKSEFLGKFSRRSALWSSKNKAGNCIWSAAEARGQRCICCHWSPALLFVLVVWKEHSECRGRSLLSAKVSHLWQLLERKTSLLEHYCTYESNLCMWTDCQGLMRCTLREHANTYVLYPSARTHTHTHTHTQTLHTLIQIATRLFKHIFFFSKIDTPGLLQQ